MLTILDMLHYYNLFYILVYSLFNLLQNKKAWRFGQALYQFRLTTR